MDSLNDELKKFQELYDKILANQGWQNSPFLKIMHAKLMKLRQEMDLMLFEKPPNHLEIDSGSMVETEDKNIQRVYIYLYTSDGKKLDAWQRLLATLDKQYISRPIYRNEIDAQYAALNAPVFINAGYAAVWVKKDSILSTSEDLKDKFEHDLMMLKDRSISLNKIDFFWCNYSKYLWKNEKLIFSEIAPRLSE
jgi:intracellular multiplication protein IcmQ